MKQNISLVILCSTKVGETALVLHTLSAEYGRRSFIVNVRKGGSMALFQPLSIIDAELSQNPKSELWRLTNIEAKYPLNGIRTNPYKNSMVLFMSEVLFRVMRDGDGDSDFFQWCQKSVLTLDMLEKDFSNYHLRFLLELCCILGFKPEPEQIPLTKLSFEEMMLLPLTGEKRSELAQSLIEYLSLHTECQLNIRSLSVLKELYI